MEAVPLLVQALTDADAQVGRTADAALGEMRDCGAVDALCRPALQDLASPAAKLCVIANKVSSDHGQDRARSLGRRVIAVAGAGHIETRAGQAFVKRFLNGIT